MLNRLKGVFQSFQQHNVKYVVIGGIAAVLYGVPRATFDLDILIEATSENVQRLIDALIDAGMGKKEKPEISRPIFLCCFVGRPNKIKTGCWQGDNG
ncbi:MAG: hypothetical protein JRF72_04770 [Deltaproteobacteria bacterium]|nr:hypothetical protein [Deltaproteobacteria bacterium]